ncbi:acrylyl-CoA reductase (NADPH) [Zavarzinia sp. CC-PAN008]|uniref:acrylyl-CoA reductase (NADPH) n=1 Tax=Zavarzinia sp. CC-PAN008 TaxID=3243332 RepID=UPI003F74636C
MSQTFRALVLDQTGDSHTASIKDLPLSALPAGEVLVRISHSTVNFKDGLAITGTAKIVTSYPMVPGIDFAGTVEESSDPAWKPGDAVVLNGWGLSERHWGGYAQYARVKSEWLVPRPATMTASQAMAVGTAGYTAMLCVMAIEKGGLTPEQGEVLVTGAAGGVGSVAIAILHRLGYSVVASTGRPETHDYLRGLGASSFIDRAELAAAGRPIGKERFAAVVDSVGSHTLANALAQTKYDGHVAACGLAQGADLPATVLPFILRGVTLHGIDSVMAPRARRLEAWARLGRDLPLDKLDAMTETAPLSKVTELAPAILQGRIRGRTVIDVNA